MLGDTRVRLAVSGVAGLIYITYLIVAFLRNPAAYLDVFVGLCDRVGIRTCSNDSPNAAGRQQSCVTKEVSDLRVKSFNSMIQLAVHLGGIRFLVNLLLIGLIGLEIDGRGYFLVGMFISFLICLVLHLRPGLVNSKTLPFLFCLSQGLLVCLGAVLAIINGSVFMNAQLQFLLARVVFSFMYPVVSTNACFNAVWALLSIYVYLSTETVRELEPLVDILMSEVFRFCFLSYWIWQLESLQTSQVRSELKATTYFSAKRTMGRLLADMCDAVMELGPDLEIKEPCPKLASLLLRHGNAAALIGEQFANLIFGEGDQDRFEEFVAQGTVPMESDENAMETERNSSLYLSLRDAYGTPVAVQLFHSCHTTPQDDICHIVGVHEVERGNGAAHANDALGEIRVDANVGDGADDAISEASAGTSRQSGDLNMVLAPLIQETEYVGPVTLLLDPLAMEILGGTVGLKALLGPLWFKGPVKDCIVNYAQFCHWMHTAVNEELCEGPAGSEFQIRLTPPLCKKQASFEFQADACVTYVEENVQASYMGVELPLGCDDEHYEMLCLLELNNSQPKWLRSKRKSRTRPSRVETNAGLGTTSL